MESYSLDISGRESGSLLQNKTFVPLDGPILMIKNSYHNKSATFVHAAWNKSGSQLVAGDCHGNIYLFYLQKNRFSLLCHLKTCTFLTFTNDKNQDILVALSDCTIVALNSELKKPQNHFDHHTSCVMHISFSKSGKTVLSCSKDQAILWHLDNFSILRVLTLRKDVDIVKVFFLSDKDLIVSAFNDSSVFVWSFHAFSCLTRFLCRSGDKDLNIKTIDSSSDCKLLACAGKSDWFIVWSIEEDKMLHTISLPENVSAVKQLRFLPNYNSQYFLSVLSCEGEVHLFNLNSMEIVCKLESQNQNGKFISLAASSKLFQVLTISLQGTMELYDLEEVVIDKDEKSVVKPRANFIPDIVQQLQKKSKAIKKKDGPNMTRTRLQSVVRKFEEYPEKQRFFIWAQILELPHNVDAFNILHQDSLTSQPFVKEYSFMNPGTRRLFLRLMSMLGCWHPVLKEMDYFQCVVFPFVKVLHRNTIMCFELLVTIISNWCQNWFIFCPFPPFNTLCIVENIIAFHDKELMAHFILQKVSAEVYAWSLLKTSFSEVFNKKQWLQLWDNILSNSLSFQLYAVAAFSIVLRNVLLRCETLKDFKDCYRTHSISASVLLKKAYHLQEASPSDIDPQPLVGTFIGIPKGAYPTFFQMAQMQIGLETATRKKIIDQEIGYLKQREDYLEVKINYLKELQDLQLLRRKLILDSLQLKDAEAIRALDSKLRSIQNLIQGNLTDQTSMLKASVSENVLLNDNVDAKEQYFQFQDYVKKLRKTNH